LEKQDSLYASGYSSAIDIAAIERIPPKLLRLFVSASDLATCSEKRNNSQMQYPQNLYSFPPVVSPDARVLILGSMPGTASLEAGEYYAHPRNAFWPIMARCLGFDPAMEYSARLNKLRHAGIALWDVLYSCRRAGSSDTAIETESTIANPVATLLRDSSNLSTVLCNGTKAATLYKRFIAPDVSNMQRRIKMERLPSTSPAHARMNFTPKLHIWHTALHNHLGVEIPTDKV